MVDYYEEELGRREEQIRAIRTDVDDATDRVEDANWRAQTLADNVAALQTEINVRKEKAAEMERTIVLTEAGSCPRATAIAAKTQNLMLETQRLERETMGAHEAKRDAMRQVEEARQRLAEMAARETSARLRLEAIDRDFQEEQAKIAAAEEQARVQQSGELERTRREGSSLIDETRQVAFGFAREAVDALQKVKELETNIAAEKECCDGLNTALQRNAERHANSTGRQAALERELATLEFKEQEAQLLQVLDGVKREHQQFSNEIAKIKHEGMLQTQTIEGALDETKRMLKDHIDEAQVTRRGEDERALAQLRDTLARAREEAKATSRAVEHLEQSCAQLKQEVSQAEDAAAEQEQEEEARTKRIQGELTKAQQNLADLNQRADAAQEKATKAIAEVGSSKRMADEREAALRQKLEELWSHLRRAREAG